VSSTAIFLVAVLFLGMGLYGLVSPEALIRPFGITLSSAAARTEVRAVYGGFGIAIAAVLTLCGLDVGGIRTGAVTAIAAALFGMAGGRAVSRLIEPMPGIYPIWFYFWVEVAGASLLLTSVLA
jgi:hypothetical protein